MTVVTVSDTITTSDWRNIIEYYDLEEHYRSYWGCLVSANILQLDIPNSDISDQFAIDFRTQSAITRDRIRLIYETLETADDPYIFRVAGNPRKFKVLKLE